jgi:probable phosphoglycerate mutase
VIGRVQQPGVRSVLVVAHGHVLRVLAARWAGLPASYGAHLQLDVATLSKLSYEHGVPTVEVWNA